MFKGRGGILFLFIIIALAVIVFLALRGGLTFPRLFGPPEEEPVIPLDLQTLIPDGWTVQAEPQLECSFDDDPELEQMLIYRYNETSVQIPLQDEGERAIFSPFGGVIFDTQTSSLEPQPSPPGAYRPSNIIPYLLLPDFFPAKGEGYLGESGVDIRYAPSPVTGPECETDEINIFGYDDGPLPTRLSIFRWEGREAGYQGVHYAGNARVESDIPPEGGSPIARVVTYNRLLNHRSSLCEVNAFTRPDPEQLKFLQDASVRTIDFCFETPSEPVYPEGIVVALLRGNDSGTGTPSSYLLNDAILPPELNLRDPARPLYNILSIGNPAFVSPMASDGAWCTGAQVGVPVAEAAPTDPPADAPDPGHYPCLDRRALVRPRACAGGIADYSRWHTARSGMGLDHCEARRAGWGRLLAGPGGRAAMNRGGAELGPEEVTALLAAGQGERVAFMPANPSLARLAETLVALANTHGGDVLLGVSASGKTPAADNPLLEPAEVGALVQSAAMLISPPLILPPARSGWHNGRRVTAVQVPPGMPHAYSVNGRYLARAGATNRLLSAAELTALLLSRDVAGFEARPAPGATLLDLDPGAVDSYTQSLRDATGESWERTLAARGCLTEADGRLVPTYAGVLLFGRKPQRFLRNAQITLIRYPGATMGDEFCARRRGRHAPRRRSAEAETFVTANMRRGMRITGIDPTGNHRVPARRGPRGDCQRGRAPRLCHPRGRHRAC